MLKATVRRSAKILSSLMLLSLLQACGEGEPTPANLALFAGDGVAAGSVDGAGTAARFSTPLGVAADSAGNIYVADTTNHIIRKIDSVGGVTTLAGNITTHTAGNTDGTGAAASFSSPRGVTTDSAGNVYVADTSNHIIRKITPLGVVAQVPINSGTITIYGAMSLITTGTPSGIATDTDGNIYVTDAVNHAVIKITPLGGVSTIAGVPVTLSSIISSPLSGNTDGIGTAARFNSPRSIAIDRLGNLYVADSGNHTIRKIVISSGVVSTLAGTALSSGSVDGLGAVARFNTPLGVVTDSAGNVYVADTGNHTIRKITPAGEVSTVVGVVGSAGFAPGFLPGQLRSPTGVAISGTSLYITTGHGVAVVTRVP